MDRNKTSSSFVGFIYFYLTLYDMAGEFSSDELPKENSSLDSKKRWLLINSSVLEQLGAEAGLDNPSIIIIEGLGDNSN